MIVFVLALLAQTTPPIDTTGFSQTQNFVLEVLKLVVPLFTAIVAYLTYLKTHETNQKADRNSQQVANLAVSVDGRLGQLLKEKDERAAVTERAARAEGVVEGLTQAAPVVPPIQVLVDPDARPGGKRKLDPKLPDQVPPESDPSSHQS